jgi:aconitate hydratase
MSNKSHRLWQDICNFDLLCNFGILPLIFKNPNDFDAIQQGSKLKLRGIKKFLEKRTIKIPVEVEGKTIITILDISDRQYNYVIAGGALNLVKEER